jgi:hypothetical protein
MTYHYSATYAVPGVQWGDDLLPRMVPLGWFARYLHERDFAPPALEFGQMDKGVNRLGRGGFRLVCIVCGEPPVAMAKRALGDVEVGDLFCADHRRPEAE